jgi:hypothetical protein
MTSGPSQKSAKELALTHPEVEFALVLARTIDSIKRDPEQLRSAIYELARQKLREQFTHEDASEARRLTDALEVAIQGVENHSRTSEQHLVAALTDPRLSSAQAVQESDRQNQNALAVIDVPPRPAGLDSAGEGTTLGKFASRGLSENATPMGAGLRWTRSTPLRYLAMLALFATVLAIIAVQQHAVSYGSLRRAIGYPSSAETAGVINKNGAEKAPPPVVPEPVAAKPSPLLPTAYGIYAVNSGKLYELEMLQGRVPDARVAISAAIIKPSETILPNGHLRFIVFRRDSATNAPDLTEVRVIARVTQAVTFDAAGKPIVSPTDDTWVMRNISFPYRASPLKDDPQMYEIQSREPDAELSPGRYALVLKGQAFDFTVDGQITDKRQCLQRMVASNGTFYSECQKP